jgi:hypothetical protein
MCENAEVYHSSRVVLTPNPEKLTTEKREGQ